MKVNEIANKKILALTIVGALALTIFSVLQRCILGSPQFELKSFIIPIGFGAASGLIIGLYVVKIRALNWELMSKVTELEEKMQRIRQLESILPICSNCKRIMEQGSDPEKMESWELIESYISRKTTAQFSHGICPKCRKELYE